MKLFIIGASGSGKTTLAMRLGLEMKVAVTKLDDLFWSNGKEAYGRRREKGERDGLFRARLNEESWIIEGAYCEWPREGFDRADCVIYMDIEDMELVRRILKRFIRRKIGLEQTEKKETFKGLRELLVWNKNQVKEIRRVVMRLEKQGKEVIRLHDGIEIDAFVQSIMQKRQS